MPGVRSVRSSRPKANYAIDAGEMNSKTDISPGYSRALQRIGPVALSTRLFQGFGSLPDTYKNFAFGTFLLFYYNQVLGLPASRASLALMIALILDAISDPLVGSWSDRFSSRIGRRHPFMYASAVPLGVFLYLVFSPPAALSGWALFSWLLIFTVLVRTAMTFFTVPWNALFAEFSEDYVERTAIITWRYVVGWFGGTAFTVLTWSLVFPSTPEFTPGHLNPEAYGVFAVVLGGLVSAAVFATTFLTRREVPYLLQPAESRPFALTAVFTEVGLALHNRNFLMVFLAILCSGAVNGTTTVLTIYMQTYFWGLAPEDLRWVPLAIIGGIIAFLVVLPLQHRFEKKRLLVVSFLAMILDGVILVSLRFLDALPDNGDPWLLSCVIGAAASSAFFGTLLGIVAASMIADTLDQQELNTGLRQEGVFASALSFSGKVTSGVGVFCAGLLLEFGLGFAAGERPATIAPDLVTRLGIMTGILVPLCNLIPVWIVSRYHLSKDEHARIQAELQARRITQTHHTHEHPAERPGYGSIP